MEKTRTSYAPLIVAIVLLILPLLYVASYLTLVTPSGAVIAVDNLGRSDLALISEDHYRCGGQAAEIFYWPLEQLDRKLRPAAWSDRFERIGIDFN